MAVPWRPAGLAYRPLWTLLFTGTGYAAYLIWRDGGGCKGSAITPLVLWFAQVMAVDGAEGESGDNGEGHVWHVKKG